MTVKTFVGVNQHKAVVGFEGGTVYNMELKESIVNMLCLGLIQGNFYQDEKEVIQRTKDVYTQAIAKCPEFLAKAAIYARNTVGMKLQPNIALVYLSTLADKQLFKVAFNHVIRNPKDLHDFVNLCRKSGIRGGMGRSVKKSANNWLNYVMTEYHACRYGGKLGEVLKATRPTPCNDEVQEIFTYICTGKTDGGMLPRAEALQTVIGALNLGMVNALVLSTIAEHGLQMEELKHTFGKLDANQKRQVFEFFIPKLAFMATVSNLVTIERAYDGQVPKNIVDIVSAKLCDVVAYKKSRMLPFRLITARDMTSVRDWQRAIERLINTGVKGNFDVPIGTQTLVAVDTSSSMNSALTPSLTCKTVASMFGAMCTLGIEGSSAYAVASTMKPVRVMTDEVFTLADQIARLDVGYGTRFEQIMQHYAGQKYVILITDGESADNLESMWLSKKVAGAKLIVWQLQAYGHRLASPKRKDVIYFQGYSESILGAIRNVIEGKGQLDDIEQVML